MPRFTAENNTEIIWFDQELIDYYNSNTSKLIVDKFGNGPFETFKETNEVMFFIHDGLIRQMQMLLSYEKSLAVYQYIQILHEQSNKIAVDDDFSNHFTQISKGDFAIYRRVLRFILEQATHLDLIFAEPLENAKIRVLKLIEELIYIGSELFRISNLIASQQLIEDSIEIYFNENNSYVIDYKHHYNVIIEQINNELESHIEKAIKDKNAINDFSQATENCLGVSFRDIIREVKSMHKYMEDNNNEPYSCAAGFDLHSLIDNLSHNSKIPYNQAKTIISGLILSQETKCSFQESIYKPQSINRHFYRPFIKFKIKGKKINSEMIMVGQYGLMISLQQLATNAIGWNKYPTEWNNECFDNYVKNKQLNNDKVLEDQLENLLNENKIKYSRNITSLKKHNNRNLDIDNEHCGEIDFLILLNNKIYIADSKHLLARYDFNNWKNDFYKFETNKANFNKTIERKRLFLNDKKHLIEEHFSVEYQDESFQLIDKELECVFLINNPTFYMYNSKHKIITIRDFERFLQGQFIYPTFYINQLNGNQMEQIIVDHPYFKKPEYIVFEEE
jgi:hypothetical protein